LKGGARRQPHGQRGGDLRADSIHSGKGNRAAGTPHKICPSITDIIAAIIATTAMVVRFNNLSPVGQIHDYPKFGSSP